MREYFKVKIWTKEGYIFYNSLTLGEANLISKIAKENKKLLVERVEVSKQRYEYLFG